MRSSSKAPEHRVDHASHVHGSAESDAATAKDPVCGMTVTLGAGKPSTAHAGVTYHFCSLKCHDKFVANPAHYLREEPKREKPPQPARTKYTCPMHPEIIRDAPGDCPKCGMVGWVKGSDA